MANFNVSYIIEAIDQFSSVGVNIRQSMNKLDNKAKNLSARFAKMGSSLSRVGKNLSLKWTLPMIAAGGATLKVASDFQHSALVMQGALKLTQEQIAMFRKEAIYLGETTIFRARQVMEGMKLMAYSGVKVGDIMSVAAKATEFATANELDFATASVLMSKVMVAFKKDAADLPKIMDTITRANLLVAGSASDIAIPLGYAALSAKQAKISFGDLTASLLIFRRAGVQASRSGTIMRKILTRLQAPIKTTKEFYKALGLNMEKMTRNGIKFNKILEVAAERHFGVGKAAGAAALIFGQRAGPAFQALVNNIGQLKSFEKELTNTGGVMERIAKKQLAGIYGGFKILSAEVEHFQLMLADPNTLVWVRKLELGLGRMFRTVADSHGYWKTLIRDTGLFLILTGPLLFALGKIVFVLLMLQKIRVFSVLFSGIKLLLNPMGLIIAAVGLLAFGFYELYKHSIVFRTVAKTLGKILYWGFYPVWIILKAIWKTISDITRMATAPMRWAKTLGKMLFGHKVVSSLKMTRLTTPGETASMNLAKKLINYNAAPIFKTKPLEAPIAVHRIALSTQPQTVTSKLDINVRDPDKHITSISAQGSHPIELNLGQNMALSSI